MSATNYTNVATATSALVNAAARQGITPSASISAEQMPIVILANALQGQLGGATLLTGAGAGFTSGTGTVYKSGVTSAGGIITTQVLVDLTGLNDFAAGDIIGKSAATTPAHIGQITAVENGTIFSVRMECLELPAGADVDIDLYSATEGTGAPDSAVSALTETLLINSGDWTLGAVKYAQTVEAGQYLYLVNGDTTAGTYTAGKYLITLLGY